MESEQADAGRDGQIRLARPNSQARTGTERKFHFVPSSAGHEQDWQPYSVDPNSALCDDQKCSLGEVRIGQLQQGKGSTVVVITHCHFSTNESPCIQQTCTGKTLKVHRNRPLSKNFMFFVNQNIPQNVHLLHKISYNRYHSLKK